MFGIYGTDIVVAQPDIRFVFWNSFFLIPTDRPFRQKLDLQKGSLRGRQSRGLHSNQNRDEPEKLAIRYMWYVDNEPANRFSVPFQKYVDVAADGAVGHRRHCGGRSENWKNPEQKEWLLVDCCFNWNSRLQCSAAGKCSFICKLSSSNQVRRSKARYIYLCTEQ